MSDEAWSLSRLLNELTDPYGDNENDAEIMRRAADAIEQSAAREKALREALERFVRIRDWCHDEDHSARNEYDGAAEAARALISPTQTETELEAVGRHRCEG